MIAVVRSLALLAIVGLMAAFSAGVLTTDARPAPSVRSAPAAQRYGPETFYGIIVQGSVTTVAGATQFTVDRPKKVGLDIDPTQRETVQCRLENVTPEMAALAVPGQLLYFLGQYDPAINIFFVNAIATTPSVIDALMGASVGAADNSSSADNDSDDSDNDSDNDSDDSDNDSDNDSDDSDN